MIFCLDTNTCIYFLNGKYPGLLRKMLSYSPNDIKIPSIVKAELLHGAEKSIKSKENKEKVAAFLLPFEIVPFDDAAAILYSKFKAKLEQAGMPIGPNDLIIAATAAAINASLVTNNQQEFSRIDGLLLANWIDAEGSSG